MATARPPAHRRFEYKPCGFDELDGWPTDDHDAALSAFDRSAPVLGEAYQVQFPPPGACARQFFETHFLPHRVRHQDGDGLFTGYYEPVLKGARIRSSRFHVPLLKRPPDLVNVVSDQMRGAVGNDLTAMRRAPDGALVPYPTRGEIEEGALSELCLEICYLDDRVAAFMLHVQGSGVIELDDGTSIRVGYAGKNGHPYTSIGGVLIREGRFVAGELTLDRLISWLAEDLERGRKLMRRNESYIFFEERGLAASADVLGVRQIPLTAGRSLAVDAGCHAIGLPVFLRVEGLGDPDLGTAPFARLMVAQDVGSAIQGPERGDIFYGTGPAAGRLAGATNHRGQMFVLLPRDRSAASG